MTIQRPKPYLHVSWLKKLLVGHTSCEWSGWFKAHFKGYPKISTGFDLSVWQMEHTTLLNKLKQELIDSGAEYQMEGQNQFWLDGSVASVSGTPDLIEFKNSEVIIYEVKTGKPNDADIMQLMIYMWAFPFAKPQYKERQVSGMVVYEDHRKHIPSSAIDDKFAANLVGLIKRLGGSDELPKVPSSQECGFCELTAESCPNRIEKTENQVIDMKHIF